MAKKTKSEEVTTPVEMPEVVPEVEAPELVVPDTLAVPSVDALAPPHVKLYRGEPVGLRIGDTFAPASDPGAAVVVDEPTLVALCATGKAYREATEDEA